MANPKTGFRFGGLLGQIQWLIILAGILIRVPLLSTPLTSYGSDSWRQADTASIAYHFYVNGYHILYPQIFWGGNGPGYVETEFQLYPFLVSVLYGFVGEHYWLGRLVSLIFSVFTWWLFYRLAKLVLNNSSLSYWALGVLVFSPLSIRYSVAFMPEATVLFFYVAALYFFLQWTSSSRNGFLYLAAVNTALAILVKPTSIHIGLIFALIAFSKLKSQIFGRWEIWSAVAVALAPGALWYWHARNLYLTYGNTFGLLSGGDSKFGSLNEWLTLHLYTHLIALDSKWILGYGLVVLSIVGVLTAVKRKEFRSLAFGIAGVWVYYLLVPRYSHEEWGIQYHIYMLPYAALVVALGVDWVVSRYAGWSRQGVIWASAGVFLILTLRIYSQMLNPVSDSLATCGAYVNQLVPKNDLIIVSTTSQALDDGVPNNYQEPQIFFYGRRYGWSLPADQLTVEKVEGFRALGANDFVIYSPELLASNLPLAEYLNANSVQVGPGIQSECAIFHFVK